MENKFFYKNGQYKSGSIPNHIIEDCSASGQVADIVHWAAIEIEFDCDMEQAKNYLRDFGAWSDAELSDHQENIERVLWLACCELGESGDWLGLIN